MQKLLNFRVLCLHGLQCFVTGLGKHQVNAENKMVHSNIDFWADMAERYRHFLMMTEGFIVPTEVDIERFQACIQSEGAIRSSLNTQLAYSYYMYPDQGERRELREICQSVINNKEFHAEMKMALNNKSLNQSFVKNLARMEYVTGILSVLILTEDEMKSHFEKYIVSQDVQVIQKYIYSYWMFPRWVKGKEKKADAEEELAFAIDKFKKNHPSLKQHIVWVDRMVKYDHGVPELQGKILKLTKPQIQNYVSRAVIKQDELPQIGY